MNNNKPKKTKLTKKRNATEQQEIQLIRICLGYVRVTRLYQTMNE